MITFNELLERTKNEKIVIHTPTEDQAETLLKMLDEKGYEWNSHQKLTTETDYEYEKENTCYGFHDYYGKLLDKKIVNSPLDWYQDEGYTIIEFKDIDFSEKLDWNK